MELKKDVKYVKGVGPNRVQLLNKLNIFTLGDLITHYPRSYEDRSKPKNIMECLDGEEALIEAVALNRIVEVRLRGKTMYKLQIGDESGRASAVWFNQSYLKNKFQVGKKYKFFGKVSNSLGRITIQSPVFDETEKTNNTGKIVPIYPSTYQLSQNVLRKIIENGLKEITGSMPETLPSYLIEEYHLQSLQQAIQNIHFPKEYKD